MAIWLSHCILEIAQTLAYVVLLLFYIKNWHADLEFACKFCFLVIIYFFSYAILSRAQTGLHYPGTPVGLHT